MPTAADQQHSKSSSKPKNTIRKYTFPEEAAATSNSGECLQGQAWDDDRMAKKARNLIRFGPAYGDDTVAKNAKEAAWDRLGDDKSPYLKSIKEIEKKVMECYDESIVEGLKQKQKRSEFRKMIARDGCFFLQLSLHILGGGDLLGYPPDDHFFGERRDRRTWISSMFFFGNQIPYVVIDALMNQDFFKDVIRRGKWRRPSDGDMVKLALYQTVVEPQLTRQAKKVTCNVVKLALYRTVMEPQLTTEARKKVTGDFTILTALRNLLLGSNTEDDPSDAAVTRRWFRDLEHGHKDNNRVHFRSATELKRSGVTLRKTKGGIANIRFKNRGYYASLYLPPFHIHKDHDMSILLTSVVQLEKSLPETEREVTSYVSLMRDLTPTYKDFDILKDQRILTFPAHNLEDAVISILDLNRIVPHSESYLTPNLRDILNGVKEYETVPWQRMRFTCSIACGIITFFLAVFTIIQTVFTVLSYYYTINPPT